MDREKLKKIKVLYYPYKAVKNIAIKPREVLALISIAKQKNRHSDDHKIRVLFILQYVPAWEKADLLYKYLETKQDFDLRILCVPNDIQNISNSDNDAYNFLHDKEYKLINATEDGKWFDINSYAPNFIITFRPYDHFMPDEYSAENLSKIGLLCNIIYGPPMTLELQKAVYSKNFFNFVSLYFPESIEAKKYFESEHRLGVKSRLQCAPFCGMPILEYIFKKGFANEASAWMKTSSLKILWTPRWNTDEKIGGSHFFDYRDVLLDYKKTHNDQIDMMFRPHPLMFSNFKETGEMTLIEQEEFFNLCSENNIVIDTSKAYLHTFGDTDILITDISSIAQEFFVLGKPIIYCPPSDFVHPTNTMNAISSACYIVNNSSELLETMDRLLAGEDTLKDMREKILIELFGDTLNNSCEQIANVLRNTARGNK